jgi:hypothetical protein
MAWNDNKRPVQFERYRRVPFLLGSKYGWFFKLGEEHANITTRNLERLLKEEKAFLVIDRDEWERLVQKYRGKPAEDPRLTALKERKASLEREAKRKAERLGDVNARLAKALKDPARSKEAAQLGLERNSLLQDALRLKGEWDGLQRQIASLAKK